MTSKRVFYVLAACLILLAGVGVASVVLGSKLLAKSATKLNDLKLETSVIDEQHNSLSSAKRDIEKYAELETIAKTVVPQEKDQARTIREIVRFAEETGVPITNITFPNSELGEAKAPAKATTPTNNGEAASTPAKPAAPPISQVKPVEGIKGVYQLEVSIQNDKDTATRYQNLINFLRKLEQNRRTSQVTNVGIQPDPKNRNLITYTMTINVYIKPTQ